jgi:hypothetical protein
MKKAFTLKSILPYVLVIFGFLFFNFLYFSPVLGGKTLSMHDINMVSGGARELQDFHAKTGEWAWWTNSMFGGMPGFMVAAGYPYSLSSKIGGFITASLPIPVNVIFLMMVGFFIFMKSLNKNIYIAFLASLAYGFGTYNLLFIEAGHVSKILALAYGPALLAGFVYVFKGRYLLGTLLTSLFLALELYANHLQITYYFVFVLAAYSGFELLNILKAGRTKDLGKIILSFAIAFSIGIGMNAERLWNTLVYAKETTRGVSELSQTKAGSSGLDRDYAFGWSYGINETFNLLVPNLMGGGSAGALNKSSETYKSLTQGGVEAGQAEQFIQQLPLYFGNQAITSGPSYSGIVIIFLFLLGLLISRGSFKWIIFGLTCLFLALSWGSNFPAFNNPFYDLVPGYNKFRAVTMILTVVHFLLVWGAANTLSDLIKPENDWTFLKKKVGISLAIVVAMMLVGYLSVNFSGPNDQAFKTSLGQSLGPDFAQRILISLQNDRADLAQSDILRGFILVALALALILAYKTNKLAMRVFGGLMILLVAFDMIGVGKRYFNNDDFVSKSQAKVVFEPLAADLEILKDADPNYRVMNLTTSFTQDARDSYFHKSMGGYHGAKLKKTQELIDGPLLKDGQLNLPIINMFNTKYLIVNGPTNTPIAQRNPEALGNAWFVDSLLVVKNADEELKALERFQPKTTAYTQVNQNLKSKFYSPDANNSIKLTQYAPNALHYSSNAKTEQFAVFSEVFYRGNKDWKSYIDGKEVSHVKVNYLLRGMEIPAGKHEIKFEFKPESVAKGQYIDLAASVGLALLLIGVAVGFRKNTTTKS